MKKMKNFIKRIFCNHDFIKIGQREFGIITYNTNHMQNNRMVTIRCRKCCKELNYIENPVEDYIWNDVIGGAGIIDSKINK